MPEDDSEGVKRSIDHIVKEIQRFKPVAYFNGCPVYASDNMPQGELWFVLKKGGLILTNLKQEQDNA